MALFFLCLYTFKCGKPAENQEVDQRGKIQKDVTRPFQRM